MGKEEKITMEAEVVEALPNAQFRVRLPNDHDILAYISGKMKTARIRTVPGDTVTVEISPLRHDQGGESSTAARCLDEIVAPKLLLRKPPRMGRLPARQGQPQPGKPPTK